jgi:cytidylate kinase
VVFPHATVKVFLTASDEERARRRALDEEAAERPVDVAAVQADLVRRDRLDAGRATSPLVAAEDALRVDSTARTIDDVVRIIVDEFHRREADA